MLSGCGGGAVEVESNPLSPITFNARLSSANSLLPNDKYAIIYRFIPTSSGVAKISMGASSFRCRLSVQEKLNPTELPTSSARRLSTSSNLSGTATVQIEVAAGKSYLVTASTELPEAVGDFTLSYPSTYKFDGYEFQNYD